MPYVHPLTCVISETSAVIYLKLGVCSLHSPSRAILVGSLRDMSTFRDRVAAAHAKRARIGIESDQVGGIAQLKVHPKHT